MSHMNHLFLLACIAFSCVFAAPPSFPFPDARNNDQGLPKCQQPMQQGLCLAYFPSFYYNASTGQCEDFIYGGCQGNQNRFGSREECMQACGGTGRSDATSVPSQLETEKLQEKSSADADVAPESKSDSASAVAEASADASASAVAEDSAAKSARSEASASASGAEEGSESAVASGSADAEDVCSLPQESGLCYALHIRFYFDSQKNKCEEFNYGGCGGNRNNFESVEECERACPKK